MKKLIGLMIVAALAIALFAMCSSPLHDWGGGGGGGGGSTPDPAPDDLQTRTVSGIEINFRYVPGTGDAGFQRDANAVNTTKITRGYWLGETEVTQELYMAVMGVGRNVFNFQAAVGGEEGTPDKLPAERVSWYDAIAFCNKLSLLDGKQPVYSVSGVTDWAGLAYGDIPTINTGAWNEAAWDRTKNGYRLPTEMEWMWAAMGATLGGANVRTTGYAKGYAGSTEADGAIVNIGNYAYYSGNAGGKTHKVAQKTQNELDLYDMSGNVVEWVWDWYANYDVGMWTDTGGPVSGGNRVVRGAEYSHDASHFAFARRGYNVPQFRANPLGFRVVCP